MENNEPKVSKKMVDEDALYGFLTTKFENGGRDITKDMMKAVNQLISLILFKHFSSYYTNEDIRQTALMTLTNARVLTDEWKKFILAKHNGNEKSAEKEFRKHYNKDMNALNFAYTSVRNEIHNTLVKVCREVGFDDLNPQATDEGGNVEDCVFYKNHLIQTHTNDLPMIARKYYAFLCGETNRKFIYLPKLDALALLIYLQTSNPKMRNKTQYSELLGRELSGTELVLYELLKSVWLDE